MKRNAISRLVEVSLLAGVAITLVQTGPALARDKVTAAKPAAMQPDRHKIATQKLMRNPWEKAIEVASIQSGAGQKRP